MKTLRITSLFAITACLMFSAGALAGSLDEEVGYIDLEWITIPDDATEYQDIDLGPILGDIAKDAGEKGDDALVQALAMVRSIRVKAFSIDNGGGKEAENAVNKITAKLEQEGWKSLIKIKDGDEILMVKLKYDGEDLAGLMILTYEPDDSVAFVNVVGDLDLGVLLGLAKQIDHDSIEDMIEGIEGNKIDDDDEDDD